jgi:hypothetical protein
VEKLDEAANWVKGPGDVEASEGAREVKVIVGKKFKSGNGRCGGAVDMELDGWGGGVPGEEDEGK